MCSSFTYPLLVHVCSETMVSAEVDEVELEDGTKIQPVSVIFPDGNTIPAPNQDQVQHCTQTSLHCFEKSHVGPSDPK